VSGLDEKLRDGVERAVFQGDDSDWPRAMGSSTGRTFSSGRVVRNLNIEEATIVRKCPVATRLIRISGELLTTIARG